MIEHVIDGCQCEGKKCTKCGQVQCTGHYNSDKRLRSGLKSKCRTCESADNRAWRESNREHDRARHRAWNEANPEKVRAMSKRRLARKRKTSRRPPVKNRPVEEIKQMEREVNQKQYAKNKQQNTARVMRYFHEHPGYRASVETARRTRKRQAGGSYTYQEWESLKAQCNYSCLSCGRQEPEIQLHADHVIPVKKGGASTIDNIQPLCKSCNSSKGTRIIDYRKDVL